MKNKSLSRKKILIVEDHPIVSKGLIQLINKQDNIMFCGVAPDAGKALDLLNTEKPDMVTVDISLKDSNGIELIKNILAVRPDMNILVISMFDENVYAERCLKAGAKGYIMKQTITKELLKAINQVLAGNIYLSKNMSAKILDRSIGKKKTSDDPVINNLSDRELEVFQLIGQGFTTEEIADKTNLGIKTVETYKSKIKEKLDLKNATQLIKYAVEWSVLNKQGI
jgi:DNA-binding NarL/FixJ family response regulator